MRKIVFWGVCAMAAFLPIPFGAVDEWAILVFEAGTAVLFSLFLLSGKPCVVTGAGGAREDPGLPAALKALLAVFFAVALIQVVPLPSGLVAALSPRAAALRDGFAALGLGDARWATISIAPALSRGELVKYAAYAMFAFLAYRCVRTRREVETVLMAVGAAAVFEAAYGLAQVFGGTEMIFAYHKKWNLGSVTGTYINRNHLAGFLEMAFPLILGLLLAKADFFSLGRKAKFRERVLWFGQEKLQKTFLVGLMAAIVGLGLVFSRSRSGLLIFLLTICAMVVALSAAGTGAGEPAAERPGRRGRRLVRTVGLVVLLAAAVAGLKPVIDRFTREKLVLENGRAHFFRTAGRIVGAYPLAGTGPGTFALAYAMFEDRDLPVVVDHAHNDYLESAAESGLVGAAALWLFFFAAFGLGLARWARRRDPFVKGVGLGCWAGVGALLLHGLTDFNLRIPANAAVFVLLIALLVRVTSLESGRREEGKAGERDGGGGRVLSGRPSVGKRIAGLALAAAVVWFGGRDYLGFRHFRRYEASRASARSVESAFASLSAEVEAAAAVSGNPAYYLAAGRLSLERAMAENEFGLPERRDGFADRAHALLAEAIRRSPAEADGFYEMGKVYMLFNFPLLTYGEKSRSFYRRAVELRPADEFLTRNVVFVFLAQWEGLSGGERAFAAEKLRAMARMPPRVLALLQAMWRKEFGTDERLKELAAAAGVELAPD